MTKKKIMRVALFMYRVPKFVNAVVSSMRGPTWLTDVVLARCLY